VVEVYGTGRIFPCRGFHLEHFSPLKWNLHSSRSTSIGPRQVFPTNRRPTIYQAHSRIPSRKADRNNYVGSDWRVNYTANESHVNLERGSIWPIFRKLGFCNAAHNRGNNFLLLYRGGEEFNNVDEYVGKEKSQDPTIT